MSINHLLNDSNNKGWANLYVNELTTYNSLNVKRNQEVQGNHTVLGDINVFGGAVISQNSTFDNNLTILGNLTNNQVGSEATFRRVRINEGILFDDNGRISLDQDAEDQFIFGNNAWSYSYIAPADYTTPGNVNIVVDFNEIGSQVVAYINFNQSSDEPLGVSNTASIVCTPSVSIPIRFRPKVITSCTCVLLSGSAPSLLDRDRIPCHIIWNTDGSFELRISASNQNNVAGQFQASTIYRSEVPVSCSFISGTI